MNINKSVRWIGIFFLFLGIPQIFTSSLGAVEPLKSYKSAYVSFQYPKNWKFSAHPETRDCSVSFSTQLPGMKEPGRAMDFMMVVLASDEEGVKDVNLKDMVGMELSVLKTSTEKKIAQFGKITGTGLEITGDMVDGKSKMTIITFAHKIEGAKNPSNALYKQGSNDYLFIQGFYATSYEGKPIFSPEDKAGFDSFLGSLQALK